MIEEGPPQAKTHGRLNSPLERVSFHLLSTNFVTVKPKRMYVHET